jgi:CheY-like chemotaxis protein
MAATVLVVDDDGEVRETLAELLGDRYEVLVATNGQDALDVMAHGPPPDLILLDIRMPVMDGWHFLSARLRHPGLVEVPIIIMSGELAAVHESGKVGACTMVRKPLELDDLNRRIEDCLRGRYAAAVQASEGS